MIISHNGWKKNSIPFKSGRPNELGKAFSDKVFSFIAFAA